MSEWRRIWQTCWCRVVGTVGFRWCDVLQAAGMSTVVGVPSKMAFRRSRHNKFCASITFNHEHRRKKTGLQACCRSASTTNNCSIATTCTMPPSSNMFRAACPVIRSAFRPSPFTTRAGARFQSTAAPKEKAKRAAFSFASAWHSLIHSPVGIKTVHFWAPVLKACLVLAGVGDFFRPAEKLSLTQNAALTSTGLIWTRWCFVITPQNMFLAAINFMLGCVGVIQCSRILLWRRNNPHAIAEAGATGAA